MSVRIVWIVVALLAVSFSLSAQPSGQYLRLQGFPVHGYIEIPHDVALDSPAMTVEAWVSVRDAHSPQCSSIAGKGYLTSWWLGLCGTTMRSYFNGGASVKDGGVIPDTPNVWIHIAAVTDGTTHKHYINGNLVFDGDDAVPLSTSTLPMRIGSDPNWDFMAAGGIDDLRIWKVARTQAQIRQTMFAPNIPEAGDVTGQFESLEAWYRFEGNAQDSWHTHHGTIVGAGISFTAAPPFRRHAVGH